MEAKRTPTDATISARHYHRRSLGAHKGKSSHVSPAQYALKDLRMTEPISACGRFISASVSYLEFCFLSAGQVERAMLNIILKLSFSALKEESSDARFWRTSTSAFCPAARFKCLLLVLLQFSLLRRD